jgi:hypothetical protein
VIYPTFFKRDHTVGLILPDVDLSVKRYSRSAFGGPRAATIEATGADVELWELLEMLRCPVHIQNAVGEVVWWGFAKQVKLTAVNPDSPRGGRVSVSVDIDSMRNRVAIAYTLVDLTTGDLSRATTDWADDLESQAEYGIRELLDSRSAATLVHAEAARDKTLTDMKYPISVVSPEPRTRESSAVITCGGWWETLAWRYYINLETDAVDTATQVSDIITAKGQFLGDIYVDDLSGLAISEERDGDASALYEAVELLELGTENFRRLLCDVDVNRNVRIYEEPPVSTFGAWLLKADGSLTNPYSEEIRRDTCPTAFWAVQSDLIPASMDGTLFSDPNLKFIDEMEYDVETDQLHPTARDAPDPWDFPIVKPG